MFQYPYRGAMNGVHRTTMTKAPIKAAPAAIDIQAAGHRSP